MVTTPRIWVDGVAASALPLPDRGLDFGDGLFETLLLKQGEPLLVDYHWQRLEAGLLTLQFPDNTLEHARQCLALACDALHELSWAALRLTITRGTAPRGYAPPAQAAPRVIISAAPLQQDRREPGSPAKVGWADIRWSAQPLLAGLKHANRLEQVLAAGEAQRRGLDEVVVLDQQGDVSSVSAGNLFIVEGDRLRTPALETCGVAGTRRRFVIERLAPALALHCEETHLSPADLERADEIFYCNSLRGLQSVGELGGTAFTRFPVCEALHQRYWELITC
ncbi:aminodeoxychorismate lyase [Halioglobus japonicus]|nr:aminodeoxychorismate lyase [Halioglobus japonicus]